MKNLFRKLLILIPVLSSALVLFAGEAKMQQFPDCSTLTTINLALSPDPVGINEELNISGEVKYDEFACSIGSRTVIPKREPTFFQVDLYTDKGVLRNFRCDLNDTCYGTNFTGRNAIKTTPSQLGYATSDQKINVSVKVYVTDSNGTAKINEITKSIALSLGQNLTYGCLTPAPMERYVCNSDPNSSQFSVCGESARPINRSLCDHGTQVRACVRGGKWYCFAPGEREDEKFCDEGYLPETITSDLCGTYVNPMDAVVNDVDGQTIGKFIPKCVNLTHGEAFLKSECGDVTIFLKLMIKIIHYLFGIIGGIALLFFVYGGFVFILSQGNADKVQHGKSIILAAVLGIIVAFSGYALVRFVGDVVGIKNDYKLQQ